MEAVCWRFHIGGNYTRQNPQARQSLKEQLFACAAHVLKSLFRFWKGLESCRIHSSPVELTMCLTMYLTMYLTVRVVDTVKRF